MVSWYQRILKKVSPFRLFVLVGGLYFLITEVIPSILFSYSCTGCPPHIIPQLGKIIDNNFQLKFVFDLFHIIISSLPLGFTWFYGMINIFLVLERKKIEFVENSDLPDNFELVEIKH